MLNDLSTFYQRYNRIRRKSEYFDAMFELLQHADKILQSKSFYMTAAGEDTEELWPAINNLLDRYNDCRSWPEWNNQDD
jgi:lipoate synthase